MGSVRLMLVDDSSAQRHIIRHRLSPHPGLEVVAEAADGLQALERYAEVRPDVVLLDLVMPGMSGQEVLQALLEQDPEARVVIVSSMGAGPAIESCLEMGARSFLQKPFDSADLERILREIALQPASARGDAP